MVTILIPKKTRQIKRLIRKFNGNEFAYLGSERNKKRIPELKRLTKKSGIKHHRVTKSPKSELYEFWGRKSPLRKR